MVRMHPDDLRAIMTATIHGGCSALVGEPGYQQMQCWNQPADSIAEADRLLAELARTALKPESPCCDLCGQTAVHDEECPFFGEVYDDTRCKCGRSWVETDEGGLCPICLKERAELAERNLEERTAQAEGLVTQRLTESHALVQMVRQKGGQEERERILGILSAWPFVVQQLKERSVRGQDLNNEELRIALEPKPEDLDGQPSQPMGSSS